MNTNNETLRASVTCGACNASFEIDQLEAGLRLKCPFCQVELLYDAPETTVNTRRTFSADDLKELWRETFKPEQRQEKTIKPVITSKKVDAELKIPLREHQIVAEENKDQNSDYVLLDFLGQGGMGIVYQACQISMNRQLALKTIRAEIAEKANEKLSFLKEAVVTGNLEHPNIVPIHNLGITAEGVLFYTMKEIKGKPWNVLITEYTEEQNINILLEVSDAIAYAHQKGIIHRDIKPENVMLGDFGEVMVTDWGLAVCYSEETTIEHIPTIFEKIDKGGTPAYMSPEMAICEHTQLGPASDIYLLGGILYEIMTGKRPHAGRDIFTCMYAAMENMIQASDKKNELIDVALKAMAYYPEDRFASVKDFQQAIRNCQQHAKSIDFSNIAMEDYFRATKTGEYDDFSQALLGFREALKLWEDNKTAHAGMRKATYAYAERAFQREDLDLAKSVLDSRYEEHLELIEKIEIARDKIIKRQKRGQLLVYSLTALVVMVVIIIVVAFIQIKTEEMKTRSAYLDAKKSEETAKKLLTKVEQEKDRAVTAEKDLRKMVKVYHQEKKKAEETLMKIVNLQGVLDQEKEQTSVVKKIVSDLQQKWYDEALENLKHKNLDESVKALKNTGDYDPENLKDIIIEARSKYGKKLNSNEIFALIHDSHMHNHLIEIFLNNKDFNSSLYYHLKKIELQVNGNTPIFPLEFSINTLNSDDISLAVRRIPQYVESNGKKWGQRSFNLKLIDGLPIHRLTLENIRIKNLYVLNDSGLKELRIINCNLGSKCKISLPSVKNLVLTRSFPVNDFRFNAPSLKIADLSYTDLKSLDVIPQSKLEKLNISYTQIADLNDLAGMPLKELYLSGCTGFKDIRPILNSNTLEKLVISRNVTDFKLLKSMKSLKFISTDSLGDKSRLKSVEQFWNELNTPDQ